MGAQYYRARNAAAFYPVDPLQFWTLDMPQQESEVLPLELHSRRLDGMRELKNVGKIQISDVTNGQE